jgi:hypothetical protein
VCSNPDTPNPASAAKEGETIRASETSNATQQTAEGTAYAASKQRNANAGRPEQPGAHRGHAEEQPGTFAANVARQNQAQTGKKSVVAEAAERQEAAEGMSPWKRQTRR